jgi:hypothetical protein
MLFRLHTYTVTAPLSWKCRKRHPPPQGRGIGRLLLDTWSSDPAWQPKWQWSTAVRTWNMGDSYVADVETDAYPPAFCPAIWMDPLRKSNKCELWNNSCKCDSPPSGPPGGKRHLSTALSRSHSPDTWTFLGGKPAPLCPRSETPLIVSHILVENCFDKGRCTHYCNAPSAIFQQVIPVDFESLGIRYMYMTSEA